jgi:methyl-accepting chemotaxis protein
LRIVKPLTLVLVALIIASLVEPAIHVEAQGFPLKVTSSIVTFGGELGFLLNRTLLDHAHPVKTSPILYFWLSTNSLSHINGSELRIATLNVGSAPLIYGTLQVPATVLAWVKAPTAKVYLKISASPDIGALAVVSERAFTLVLDLALTSPTLAVIDPQTGGPQTSFAYYRFFGVADNVTFNLNLEHLLRLGVRSSELDTIKIHNVTLTYKDQLLYASLDLELRAVYTNFLRAVSGSGSTRLANITGFIGDFPLLYPELSSNIAGVLVAYQPFNVTLTSYTKIEVKGGLKIDRGVVRGVLYSDVWRAPIVSAVQPGGLQLYPSINYNFASDRPTVGTVFHLDARNFKPGVYTLVSFYRAESPLGPYVLMPNTRSIILIVDSRGRGSASAPLPDNPYGGRFTLVTVSFKGLDGPWTLAKPGDRVYPWLSVTGFDNEGAPGVEPRFVPGEYILVHGRGWLDVPFEQMNATIAIGNTTYTLEVLEAKGVDRQGVLAAILKIPLEAVLPHGSTITFNLSTDAFNLYSLTGSVRFERPVVYVQPRPLILKVTPGFVDARIALGADRFPYTAFWEPEQLRRFTVEAIALPPGARATLHLRPINLVITGFNETGIGYVRVEAPVPEVPQGTYTIRASWDGYVESSPKREYSLRVWATVAVIIPVYGKIVVLPSPYDITIKGVGFTPELRMYYDIPKLGLFNASILGLDGGEARANERSTFTGFIPLSTIAKAPNTYIIKVHQRPDNGTIVAEFAVTIGVPPPLTVEVRVAPVRFADERVGVWITALYGGIIASSTQVPEAGVKVTLILRWTGGFKEAELTVIRVLRDRAVFLAEFTPVRVFGPEALGGEVFVVVTVTGRYTPEQQEDHTTTTALITIPPVTLASVVEVIQSTPRALTDILEVTRRISGNLDHMIALMTEQGALIASSLSDLEMMLGKLGDNITVVKLSLDRIAGDIGRLSNIVLRVEGNVNSSLATLSVVRSILENVENAILSIEGNIVAIRTSDIPGVFRALASVNQTLSELIVLQVEGVKVMLGDLKGITWELGRNITVVKLSLDNMSSNLAKLFNVTLRIEGGVNTALATLTIVERVLESVRSIVISIKGDTIAIRTADLPRLLEALASLNKTLVSRVTLEIEGVKVAVGDLRSVVIEGFKALSDNIATSTLTMISRMEAVLMSLSRLTEASTTTRGLAESISRDVTAVRGALENLVTRMPGLESKVGIVESKVDAITAKLANLSEKSDIEKAKATVVEEVGGARATLIGEIRLAEEAITTSTRNWVLLNTVLTLLTLALIAYTLFLVRRAS